MGDAHEVVVDDIGEVVGGQTVRLHEDLVVQGGVLHRDVAEHHVVEGGGAFPGDLLADDIGHAGGHLGPGFLQAQGAAGIVAPVKRAGVLLGLGLFAEAVVGVAPLHQELGVLAVKAAALGLHIGSHRAAQVGTLVPVQAALAQGVVDHVHGALHQAALVGVLDAEQELAAVVPGDEPGVQGGAQVAHVHIACGRGGETSADLSPGDAPLHLVKPIHIQSHLNSSNGWAPPGRGRRN